MIKSKYIIGLFLSAGFLLTACQSEPEVGSTLYPTEAEDYSVKAYIPSVNSNLKSVIEQGVGQNVVNVPNDVLQFKVRLTEPAAEDLIFKVNFDKSISGSLDESVLTFVKDKVVIPKGSMESEDNFEITLNPDAPALVSFTGTDKVGVRIESLNGITLAKQNTTYSWQLEKLITNINSVGTIDGLTQVSPNDYEVSNYRQKYPMNSEGLFLNDEVMYTYYMSNAKYTTIHIVLNEPTDVAAIGYISTYNFPGFGVVDKYAVNDVEVRAGLEQGSIKKIGDAHRTELPTKDNDPWNITFFEPIKAKYIDIVMHNGFSGTDYNGYTSGIRLYKK